MGLTLSTRLQLLMFSITISKVSSRRHKVPWKCPSDERCVMQCVHIDEVATVIRVTKVAHIPVERLTFLVDSLSTGGYLAFSLEAIMLGIKLEQDALDPLSVVV